MNKKDVVLAQLIAQGEPMMLTRATMSAIIEALIYLVNQRGDE